MDIKERLNVNVLGANDEEFNGYMMDYFINCSNDIAPTLVQDSEYMEASNEYDRIRAEIESYLPDDKKGLIDELYSADSAMDSVENEMLFIKGLQHGVQFARLLKLSGKGDFIETFRSKEVSNS